MKYSIIFDKLTKCLKCVHNMTGPTRQPASDSACTWCERNTHLFHYMKDHYEKIVEKSVEESMGNINVEDDTNPVEEENREFLGDLLNPGASLSKKRKKKGESNGPTEFPGRSPTD